MAVNLYACRVAYVAQYPVDRDADSRLKEMDKYDPAPESLNGMS